MKCHIVKDLLSNYIDGLCSEETSKEIKAHLDGCGDCRAAYEKMSAVIPQEIPLEEKDIDFLIKLKKRMVQRNVLVAISTLLVVLFCFFIFAKNYEVPLPFDANRMLVEFHKVALITGEDGTVSREEIAPELLGGTIPEDSAQIRDAVKISYRGINNIGSCSRVRTISRGGEKVSVFYYCYTKTLWDRLFVDSDFLGYSESGSENDIFGNSSENADDEPQLREIYYLPIRNLDKIDELSDEEYDKLRENCELIWSGVV